MVECKVNELKNNKYIFTGGPGAGKTTVLDTLKLRGFRSIIDVAREIIKTRLASGVNPRPEPSQFARDIFDSEVANYLSVPPDEVCIFDRSIVDALGMLHSCQLVSMNEVNSYLLQYPYNTKVFFFPPWENIYCTDSERDQSWTESVVDSDYVKTWYSQCKYKLIEVPIGNIEDRVSFIGNIIGIDQNSSSTKE